MGFVKLGLGAVMTYPSIYKSRLPNAGAVLAQRRRRWASTAPALGQRLLTAASTCGEVRIAAVVEI